MNLFELSAKISVDDTNFKKSMENAQKVSKNVATAMKNLQSPLDKAKSGFNAIAHPVETAKANIEKLKNATEAIRHPIETFKNKVADASTALETKRNKLSTLAAGYDSAKKKVADITKEFNKSAKESGTSSQKTQELAKKLNEAEKEAEEAKKELDDYSKSVSKAGKNSESASKGVGNFASKLGKGLATAGKVAGAALGVAAAGVTVLTSAAVNSFAEYEQLAGGAQKIFDQMDYSKIAADANNAYKELGLSANQYLAVINDVGATFAATMGDEAGYEAAKTGLKAISDYASGTGKNVDELSQKFTLITRSTSSYQSIADQFSGILPATSAGFLEQAQAAGILSDSYTQLTEVPIAEYQAAVSQMLEQGVKDLGLFDNTVNEAFSTLSGSLSMAKGAWSNLVTGLADDSADLDMLIGNFAESVGAVATQLIPKVGTALGGVVKLVRDLIPVIVKEIPPIINENLPILADAAIALVEGLTSGIEENSDAIAETAIMVVMMLLDSVFRTLPQVASAAVSILLALVNGISENLPLLIPAAISTILTVIQTILNPETLNQLVVAAVAIIQALAVGLSNALPEIITAINLVIEAILTVLLKPENLAMLLSAAVQIIMAVVTGIINTTPEVLRHIVRLITQIIAQFKDADWQKIGSDLVAGFKAGIANAWTNLKKWFKGLFGDLIGIAKSILGIASPSKVFKKLGVWTADGFGIGFEDEFAGVKDEMEKAMTFDDMAVNIGGSIRRVGSASASHGGYASSGIQDVNVVVTIDENVNAMGLARELLPYLKIAAQEAYA